MIRPSLSPAHFGAPTASTTPRHVAPSATPVRLSDDEQSSIADAFPERPTVAQRLYGAGREVRTTENIGHRLDFSA